MEDNFFWEIIGNYNSESGESKYCNDVTNKLSVMPITHIYQFEIILQQKMRSLCNWDCYGVFALMELVSDDHPFQDFRLWIIAHGESFYTKFLKNPELLSDELLNAYNHNEFYLESLSSVTLDALMKQKNIGYLEYFKDKSFLDPREYAHNIDGGYGYINDLTGEKLSSNEDYQRKYPRIFDGTEGEFLRYKESNSL